jgi:hypothetical protein
MRLPSEECYPAAQKAGKAEIHGKQEILQTICSASFLKISTLLFRLLTFYRNRNALSREPGKVHRNVKDGLENPA